MPRQDFSDVRISKKQRAIEKQRAEQRAKEAKAEAEKLHRAALRQSVIENALSHNRVAVEKKLTPQKERNR